MGQETIRHRGRFLLLVALGMVGLRLLIFDNYYFKPEIPPNHDMSAGLGFFATSMHSVRLTGEPAWWNPVGDTGYAQYYQAFFSPLAPTTSHIVFILWAQLVRLLALCGVAVPEYYQYLIVNYVVLPFLAAWSFALFASLLFRRGSTVVLVSTAWTLSGIGVWNSSWFYFQEPFTLFLLLSACVAALRRPTPRRMLLLVGAALIQAVSVNYWTVYNLFFVVIVLGCYARVHPHQPRRLLRRAWQATARRPYTSSALGLGVLAALPVWGVLLGSVLREQGANYARSVGHFTMETAAARTRETRQFTLELFNPNLARPLAAYRLDNPVHNARYVGCMLVPLLLLFPLRRWRRQDRWLVLVALGVLVVCLVPPWLLLAWKHVPQMDRVRHIFYFYTHYWQILVVLVAGASFDALFREARNAAVRARFVWATGGLSAVLAVLLVGLGVGAQVFETDNPHLQGTLTFALLTLGVTGALLQALWFPGKQRQNVFVAVTLVLLVTDLSRYYAVACHQDRHFTHGRLRLDLEFSKEARETLRSPWRGPDPDRGWEGGLTGNLPFGNELWPRNAYMIPKANLHLASRPEYRGRALDGGPVAFYPEARHVPPVFRGDRAAEIDPEPAVEDTILPVQQALAGPARKADEVAAGEFAYSFATCGYNDFALEVTAPRAGWVYLRQLHDRLWKVTVDGRPVEALPALFVGMGVPVDRGRHRIRLEYRPLVRGLYGPACFLLEAVLGALGLAAWRVQTARVAKPQATENSLEGRRRAA